MKVKDIITEAPKDKYAPQDLLGSGGMEEIVLANGKKVATFIKKYCKPWLKETQNGRHWVYRGFKNIGKVKLAFTKLVRSDRRPLDTSKRGHDTFNTVIGVCGKVANRSNSLFVTGDVDTAGSYGDVYIVMPIGDFNYTWSPEHGDWTDWEHDIEDDLDDVDIPIKLSDDEKNKLIAKFRTEYQKKHAQKNIKTKPTKQSSLAILYDLLKKIGYKGTLNSLAVTMDHYDLGYSFSQSAFKHGSKYYKDWMGSDSDAAGRGKGYIYKLYKLSKEKSKVVSLVRSAHNEVNKKSKKSTISYGNVDVTIDSSNEKEFIKSSIRAYVEKLKNDERRKHKGLHPEAIKKQICPYLKGDDNTLQQAIRREHEIMLASEKALAIQPVFYREVVLPLLRNKKPNFNDFDIQDIFEIENEERDW